MSQVEQLHLKAQRQRMQSRQNLNSSIQSCYSDKSLKGFQTKQESELIDA